MKQIKNSPILLEDLANLFNLQLYTPSLNSEINNFIVTGVNALETAINSEISFISNKKYLSQVIISKAGAIVISQELLNYCLKHYSNIKFTAIISENTYATFAYLFQYFYPTSNSQNKSANSIHESTSIHSSVRLGKNVKIGAFCNIEENTIIEDNVTIGANCSIGYGCHIKHNSHLYSNISIYHECIIGNNNIIHSGTIIGSDGFGFAPDLKVKAPNKPKWVKIPQIGIVIIEDDVEIGANTTIDRATFGATTIGLGSKIDNQVQIGHNVTIGQYCVIAGCTAIAGSTSIGNFCIIGGCSQIAGHLTIANHTIISGGTGVMHSTYEPIHLTGVFPAMEHKIWERNAAILKQLQNLRKQIKQLENKIR